MSPVTKEGLKIFRKDVYRRGLPRSAYNGGYPSRYMSLLPVA